MSRRIDPGLPLTPGTGSVPEANAGQELQTTFTVVRRVVNLFDGKKALFRAAAGSGRQGPCTLTRSRDEWRFATGSVAREGA